MSRAEPYVKHDAVLEYLAITRPTLDKLMSDGRTAGLAPPYIDLGTGSRPCYRWRLSGVDRWAGEVQSWRASRKEERAGRSNGAIPTEPSGPEPAPPPDPPKPSSATSRRRSPPAVAGNLQTLVRSLTSAK